MTREKLNRLLKIEKTMAAEACLSCGGVHAGEEGLSSYEVSEIVAGGRYERAEISVDFAIERGDEVSEIIKTTEKVLTAAKEGLEKGEKTELEYARCLEAGRIVFEKAGQDYEEILKRFLEE